MHHIKWSGEKISNYLFSKTHTPKTSELITDDLPCPLTKMSWGGGCLSIIHVITLRRKLHIRVKQPLRGKRLVSALRMRVGIFYSPFKAVVLKWHRIWLWAIETSVLWNLLDHIISSLHCKSRFPLTSTSPTHSPYNVGTSEVPPDIHALCSFSVQHLRLLLCPWDTHGIWGTTRLDSPCQSSSATSLHSTHNLCLHH